MKKFEKELMKEVGAGRIVFGKLQGKNKGKVIFESKEVDIAFEKS